MAAVRYRGESAARGTAGRADIGFRKLITGESVVLGTRLAWRTSRSSKMSCALSPWDIMEEAAELPPGDEEGETEPVKSRVEPGELIAGEPLDFSAEGMQISRGGLTSGSACRCFSSLTWFHISASILRSSTGTSAVAPLGALLGCAGQAHADGGSVGA